MMTVLTAGLMLSTACGSDTREESVISMNVMSASMSDITVAEWDALASRRIFFGHQSVGRNIIAGMHRVLADNPQIPIAVTRSPDPSSVTGPAFIESDIGANGRPESKDAAFRAVLEGGLGDTEGAVAMYKYCYVDMKAGTDPDALFAEYAAQVNEVRTRYPDLTIVHFTVPLRTASAGFKEQVKTFIGRPTEIRLNVKRNRFNELVRERFAGTDPIFDLALIESTRADGSRAYTSYLGQKVYMLAPELTDDGGHLNEDAQYAVAERLLVFLARLEGGVPSRTARSGTPDSEPTGGRADPQLRR